ASYMCGDIVMSRRPLQAAIPNPRGDICKKTPTRQFSQRWLLPHHKATKVPRLSRWKQFVQTMLDFFSGTTKTRRCLKLLAIIFVVFYGVEPPGQPEVSGVTYRLEGQLTVDHRLRYQKPATCSVRRKRSGSENRNQRPCPCYRPKVVYQPIL